MRRLLQIGMILVPLTSLSATWFVRPGVYDGQDANGVPLARPGVYGAQNGTDYTNAWNGLRSIVWGAGGVNPGDTLYVCGTHIYSFTNDTYLSSQAAAGCTNDITVRMDWSGDPGLVFGGAIDNRPGTVWHGPDANGVYWSAQAPLQGQQFPICFEVDGTNLTRLTRQTNSTWLGGPGSAALINGTNFVKTLTGAAPSTNLAIGADGWRFWLLGNSNVVFRSCHFVGCFPFAADQATTYVTFDHCTFLQGAQINLYCGQDHWTIANSEVGFAPCGIYTHLNGWPSGPNYLTVSNCYIHDCDTANYPSGDGHGIGVQGSSFCVLTHNRIERTGSAIEFWTYSAPMSNNVICFNAIHDVHACTVTAGNGIGISGNNTYSVPGLRTGIQIYGNVIWNTEGAGIGSNNKDYMQVFNNTIYNAQVGIDFGVVGGNATGMVQNNVIAGSRGSYTLAIVGDAPSTNNLLVDHNLYATNSASTNVFVYTTLAHDLHSVFAEPLFVSNPPSAALDFRLSGASPAIEAGAALGLDRDFIGTPVPTNPAPDLGAFQSLVLGTRPLPPGGLHLAN